MLHYPDTVRYGFGNLVTCGSPWHCPVCAPKITECRRAELMAAAVKAVKDGGELVMMTLTYRHQVSMTLADSLGPFYKARKQFMESQAFKGAMRDVGALGRIYSTEVTFGQNGWHPHLHILIFCGYRAGGLLERLEKLRDYWSRFVMKSGLGQINEHGFDVRNGNFAAQYIASYGKEPATFVWSAAHELAKSHVKQGRNGNVTPFDLLRIGATGEVVSCGQVDIDATRARELYLEFAVRFHGKKQLEWSKGLRAKFGIKSERSDDEVAEGAADADLVGTISLDDWKLILNHRNGRGALLAMLSKGSGDDLPRILDVLRRTKPNRPDEPWFSEETKFRGY